jgi:hypothetical protein
MKLQNSLNALNGASQKSKRVRGVCQPPELYFHFEVDPQIYDYATHFFALPRTRSRILVWIFNSIHSSRAHALLVYPFFSSALGSLTSTPNQIQVPEVYSVDSKINGTNTQLIHGYVLGSGIDNGQAWCGMSTTTSALDDILIPVISKLRVASNCTSFKFFLADREYVHCITCTLYYGVGYTLRC